MLRRFLVALSAGTLFLGLSVPTVFGGNPAGTGQPGAECGEEGATSEPAGFLTSGFENAESNYAGSDGTPSLANANSDHAVSQYDVACFQVTQHH
jgi:hypothetical protein